MGRRDKELLKSVEIESVAAEGKSIAHVNGKVLFVPFAVPGDVADIQVKSIKKGYMEGSVVNFIKYSPLRIEPFCSHFGVCGGCKWQSLPYSFQLQFKAQQVVDQLTRIGHLQLPEVLPIMGSQKQTHYRNKLEFTFSSKRWIETLSEAEDLSDEQRLGLGFHIAGLFDKVLDIETCYLQPSPSNEIRLFIKEYAINNNLSFFDLRQQTGFLRTLIIRTSSTGDVMVTVVFANEHKKHIQQLLQTIQDNFNIISSLNYIINSKKNDSISDLECHNFSGSKYIYEKMEGLKFRIGPKSFYQTNSAQAYRLYCVVREFAALTGNETLYDLYTGTGTIALFLADRVKKVVGIEYVDESIMDAEINAKENNINNSSFFAGDMKDILNQQFIEQNGKPDVVVLDPPRAGVHPDVIKVLLECSPKRIVYVSCNPATQARDIAAMTTQYRVAAVQPVDMFPHTHHLENVVLLTKITDI